MLFSTLLLAYSLYGCQRIEQWRITMAMSQKTSQLSLILKFHYTRAFCNAFTPQPSLQIHKYSNLDSRVSSLVVSISSCTSSTYCRMIHCLVIKSISYNHGFIGDQLVSAYIRIGCTEDAHNLFDELPKKDLISWNSLISGFSRTRDLAKCLNALSRMKFETEIRPNEVTILPLISACSDSDLEALDLGKYLHGFVRKLGLLSQVKIVNALVNMYGKSGSLHAARCIFDEMPMKNLVSWNSIIAVHVQLGLAEEGMRYFIKMRRFGIVSDQATLVSMLQACEIVGLRKLLEAFHGYITNCGLNLSLVVGTALLGVYSDLGLLSASEKIFREIIDPDAVAWSAMIACYAAHGCGKEAIEHFEIMVGDGVVPDNVTFTHLLSACSHSGLVKEGKFYFENMLKKYGVEPKVDHYSCMVDLFGRSGDLDDAYELIKSMPMEPNSGVWGALIGACRVYGNVELGREVSEKLFALNPSDSRNYIMLSNIYSAAGQWEDAAKVRVLMKERNVLRNPGCSFIEHGNRTHCFVMGDESHPESKQIYNKLEELIGKVKETGYAAKTEFVLHNVDEDAKEDMINKHSEKLAMAYGLVVSNADEPLIITKNLRICGDCHSFAKLISLIEKRTIIIRDTKRFHHFANGLCSCGDYW